MWRVSCNTGRMLPPTCPAPGRCRATLRMAPQTCNPAVCSRAGCPDASRDWCSRCPSPAPAWANMASLLCSQTRVLPRLRRVSYIYTLLRRSRCHAAAALLAAHSIAAVGNAIVLVTATSLPSPDWTRARVSCAQHTHNAHHISQLLFCSGAAARRASENHVFRRSSMLFPMLLCCAPHVPPPYDSVCTQQAPGTRTGTRSRDMRRPGQCVLTSCISDHERCVGNLYRL